MSSAKTERLVNLTMALLASPRYLQKSEIFRKVAGYTGSQETKERMFERDKDDLRSMGIEIEVASHDPLFEDEPGYRIKREKFQLPIDTFDADDLSILATALGMWSESQFNSVSTGVLRRIGGRTKSLSNTEQPFSDLSLATDGLVELSRALASRSTVTFEYLKADETLAQTRRVNPLGISGWHGAWYLVGEDLDRNDIRVFKLSRVISKIEVGAKRASYEIPDDFDVRDYLIMYSKTQIEVEAFIRKGSGHDIRNRAISVLPAANDSMNSDWDLVKYHADSHDSALREALWFADVLVIKTPENLREEVIACLKNAQVKHG